MPPPNVNYCLQKRLGLEFVYIDNAKMSYPEHNHASIYTVGLVLHGEVVLKKKDQLFRYKPNMMFVVCPYEPHAIYSENSYSMIMYKWGFYT